MNLCPLPLFRERFPFSTRSASADNRERSRKQASRAIPAQPFAERREDYRLPGAIEVQLLRNCRRHPSRVARATHPTRDRPSADLSARRTLSSQTIGPSPSNAASTVSFLSRLMWTYRVNPQTIASTVVPTMSRTSGAFRFVVGFFVVQLKAYHVSRVVIFVHPLGET